MLKRLFAALALVFVASGCATVEGGFRYEYDGRVLRADGKTPVKSAEVRVARPDAPEAPEMPQTMLKDTAKYMDRSDKKKTDGTGRFVGVLNTVKGWRYTEFNGMHTSGPMRPPEPPMLNEVIVYVQEKKEKWMGYRLAVPAEAQSEAYSGVRKLHLPDLLLPDKPTTAPSTTQPTTAP